MGVAHMSDLLGEGVELLKSIVAIVALSATASATTVERMDLSQVVHQSDRAFLASVVSVTPEWCASESRAYTTVVFRVEKDLKGNLVSPEWPLRLLGGTAQTPEGETVRQVTYGMPEFQVGERTIVFASDDRRLYCPVTGWYQGRYRVQLDAVASVDRVYDNDGHPVTSLLPRGVQVSADGEAVTLTAFLAKLDELAAMPPEPPSPIQAPRAERLAPCPAEMRLPVPSAERPRAPRETPLWPWAAMATLLVVGSLLVFRRK